MSAKPIRVKLGEQGKGQSDWKRVDAMSGAKLERTIAADPDADIPNPDWTRARLLLPQPKQSVHLRLDPDLLAWYRQQGSGHLTRMNAVLRAYMEAHRDQRT
jgi:uncharacterized protein (DUF4415 family)